MTATLDPAAPAWYRQLLGCRKPRRNRGINTRDAGWYDRETIRVFIADVGRLLIAGVVVAVGLTLQLKRLRGVGRQLFTTGLMATVAVAAASLALISLLTLTA